MTNDLTNDQKFAALRAALGTGPEWNAFLADPMPALEKAGIPTVSNLSEVSTAPASLATIAEQLTVESHWWGQNYIMNEKLTQDIIDGLEGEGALTELIAIASGVGTVVAAGLAFAFIFKIVEIKIVDNGNGVYWPITWVQWAALLAAVPLGPAGIAAAAEVFIHPLRN